MPNKFDQKVMHDGSAAGAPKALLDLRLVTPQKTILPAPLQGRLTDLRCGQGLCWSHQST